MHPLSHQQASARTAEQVYLSVVTSTPRSPDDAAPRLVVDIGIATTQLVLGEGLAIRRIETFAIGAVRHSLAFFGDGRVDAAGFDAAVSSSRNRFAESALGGRGWQAAYGACATVRALGEIACRHDEPVTLAALARVRERIIDAGCVPAGGRAAHLAGGLALLTGLMEELEIAALWDATPLADPLDL